MSIETLSRAWFVIAFAGCAYPVNDLGPVGEAGTTPPGKSGSGGSVDGGTPDAKKPSFGTGGFGSTGGSVATGGQPSGGFGGGFGGASSCSVELSDPACNACMQAKCCANAEICVGNADCAQLMACASSSTACESVTNAVEYVTCAAGECPEFASGQSALLAYLNCMDSTCATSCQ